MVTQPLGLYIHIPFCSRICHYCDFAKTAAYSDTHVEAYFERLCAEAKRWFSLHDFSFSSVFFGGGTPGLFGKEYHSLFEIIRPRLRPDCEISLEANPDNVEAERLQIWRDLGVTRLSIGIQSFEGEGLRFLTREHSSEQARAAVEKAARYFNNLNIDLIYGWADQTLGQWEKDLQIAVALPVTHLSLYNLTYESTTVIGRREKRGVAIAQDDDALAQKYERACEFLGSQGFVHEEVSNWSLPDHSCRHNWLYWQDQHFLGIGVGAHGYLPQDQIGMRYFYPKSLTSFNQGGGFAIDERGPEQWLLEYVGCGLRCSAGIDLARIKNITGKSLVSNEILRRGFEMGSVYLKDDRLYLSTSEWFRETAWAQQVIASLSD